MKSPCLPIQEERRRPRLLWELWGYSPFPVTGSCLASILKISYCLLTYPFPWYLSLDPPHPTLLPWLLSPSPSPSPAGGKGLETSLSAALSFSLTLLVPVSLGHIIPSSSPQDSQLPLVVAMQERVGGSPHCKITAACVHQDVELSEKGERKMLLTAGSGLTTLGP